MTYKPTTGRSMHGVILDEYLIGKPGVSDNRNSKCGICGLKFIDHNREMNRACDEQYSILYDNFQIRGGRWDS